MSKENSFLLKMVALVVSAAFIVGVIFFIIKYYSYTRLDDSETIYPSKGIVDIHQGTVTCKVKLLPSEIRRDHMIFQTDDSRVVLFFDTYWSKGLNRNIVRFGARAGGNKKIATGFPEASIIIDNSGELRDYRHQSYSPSEFPENEWHLIAMTWKGYPEGTVQIFLDNKLMGSKPYNVEHDDGRPLFKTFSVGFRPSELAGERIFDADKKLVESKPLRAMSTHKGGIEIKDLRVYRRALKESDLASIAMEEKGEKVDGKSPPVVHETEDELVENGIKYLNEGKNDDAVAVLNKAINLNPNDARAYYNRGLAHKRLGNYDQAMADDTKAIELGDLPYAYMNRGIIYSSRGDINSAIADYDKTIQLMPKDAIAYYNRGNAYSEKGSYDQAISDYSKAIEFNPGYEAAYCNRGNAYSHQGNFDKAITDLNKAVELDPTDPEGYRNRGFTYDKMGDRDQAILDYNKAIELGPKYARPFFNRGTAYLNKGLYDQAISDCSKALELDPYLAEAYYSRAVAYYFRQERYKALDDVRKAKVLRGEVGPEFFARLLIPKFIEQLGGESKTISQEE